MGAWNRQAGLQAGEPGDGGDATLPGYPEGTVAFDSGHTYTWLVLNTAYPQTTTKYFWALPYGNKDTYTTTYSGGLNVTIVAHPPAPQVCKAPWAAAPDAHAAAITEVHVVCAQPDCQFHKGGAPADAWLPAEKDTILKVGDEVSCDPDGALTLAFADNSTVVVRNTTQLSIGSFFTAGGVVKTEILLKMGEVAAQVNKSEATKSDFRIKSPTGTISVRGTIFTVFYDPGSAATLVSTQRGAVSVIPANLLRSVVVPAGREVELTKKVESKVAAIGKAGARGGTDVLKARDLVLAVIAQHNAACQTTTPRTNAYSIQPAPGGWLVSVKLLGALHGTSTWNVKGTRVTAVNAIAAQLARGCH